MNICVPRVPVSTGVYIFLVRPLRKDSTRASPHIWMGQRLEDEVAGIVTGGFILVFSCAFIVPVALARWSFCAKNSLDEFGHSVRIQN